MSIAEKLKAIAENEQKVFEAGKRAVLSASRYMNGAVSGEIVAVNDVSSVAHDVAVTLSSESVTDLSSVTVKRYGKNLLDNNTDKMEVYVYVEQDGVTTTDTSGYRILLPAGTYTVHAEPLVDSFNEYIYHIVNTPDGRSIRLDEDRFLHPVVATSLRDCTFTVDEPFYYCIYNAVSSPSKNSNHLNVSKEIFNKFNIQLEVCDTATPYTPYIEPVSYQAEGETATVESLSPCMTLFADTEDVTLDCAYLRDIDTYIDSLTGGA